MWSKYSSFLVFNETTGKPVLLTNISSSTFMNFYRFKDNEDHLALLKHYADNHSAKKYNLDLLLQKLDNPS